MGHDHAVHLGIRRARRPVYRQDERNEQPALCREISASNPCAEQPLPPFGACLLVNFNLVKYVDVVDQEFDWTQFRKDIRVVVRAMDNVVDQTISLEEQEVEAKSKRRMGLGITRPG